MIVYEPVGVLWVIGPPPVEGAEGLEPLHPERTTKLAEMSNTRMQNCFARWVDLFGLEKRSGGMKRIAKKMLLLTIS